MEHRGSLGALAETQRGQGRPFFLLLLLLLCHAGPARAAVSLWDGPECVRTDRWRYLVAEATSSAPVEGQATLELVHRSGRREQRRFSVPSLGALRHEEYLYAGHPDPVVAAELHFGAERQSWSLPGAIPPARVLLVASRDETWLPRVAAALAEPAVGVEQRVPAALPGRWLGLRGLAGVAIPTAELAAAGAEAGDALRRYALHGGLVLLLADGLREEPLPWAGVAEDGTYGRGRVLRWSPAAGLLPSLAPWPVPPDGARPLPLARLAAWPPMGWLAGRFLFWVLAAGSALVLLRRRPRLGAALLPGLALLAAVAPPYPAERAVIREQMAWAAGAGGLTMSRIELRAVPQRSGLLELEALPADRAAALVGLRPAERLGLELAQDPPRWLVSGRWGEPIDLLVERDGDAADPSP